MRVFAALLLSWMLGLSEAVNSIQTTKSCFNVGQNIIASFTVTNPQIGDWVGLTTSSSNLLGKVFYQQFVYTCGSTSCNGAPASGTLSMFNNMPAGSYKAVLLPNNTFTPLAVSPAFTVSNSCQPTSPTRPVSNPTLRPTVRPNPAPVSVPTTINLAAAKQALQQASVQITAMVKSDKLLLQQYLRLLFHDCHGICDGCVDMSDPDNGQLNFPILGLAPIVQQFATPQTGLSRADIWVLAMNIALNNANQQPTKNPVTFDMNWIGRVDCEKRSGATCTDGKGKVIPCGPLSGPKRVIAPVNMNSLDFASFWRTNFNNITIRHAVALMGCHTVGRSFTQDIGIDGPNGWVIDNVSFNNEYYHALLGSNAKPNMTIPQLLTFAPGWSRIVQTNQGTTLPVRHFWTLTAGGKKLIMTNSEIAYVRQLDTSNMNAATGAVGCAFTAQTGKPVCPAASTILTAAEFLDNDTWLKTVKEALDLMTTNGYRRGSCPAGQLCVLG